MRDLPKCDQSVLGCPQPTADASPAPALMLQPHRQADERERQADAAPQEHKIFRHPYTSRSDFVAHLLLFFQVLGLMFKVRC